MSQKIFKIISSVSTLIIITIGSFFIVPIAFRYLSKDRININEGPRNGNQSNPDPQRHDPTYGNDPVGKDRDKDTDKDTDKEKGKDKDKDFSNTKDDVGGDGEDVKGGKTIVTPINKIEAIRLADNVFVQIPKNSLLGNIELKGVRNIISTDAQGQAEIIFNDSRRVYVFQSSGIKMSRCSRERENFGFGDCMLNGVSLINSNNIKRDVETGSVIVTPQGTLYAVAYFPKSENPKFQDETIIFVFNKKVEIKPFLKENPLRMNDYGPSLVAPENYFIITRPSSTITQIAGYNTLQLYPIPDTYKQIEQLYKYFELSKWIQPLDERVREIARQENLTVKRLPTQNKTSVYEMPSSPNQPIKTITDKFDFGQTFNGQTVTRSFILKNEDDIPVDIPIEFGDIQIVGVDSLNQGYTIIDDECTQVERLSKNKQCTIKIAYTPKSLGKHSDSLIIEQNADNTKLKIELLGESVKEPDTKVITSNNGKETFGLQRIQLGKSEKSIDIIIEGPRKIKFSESDFIITGEGKDDYEITDATNCTTVNSVEKKCSVKISFNPLYTGERKALLEVKGKKIELNGSPGDQISLPLTRTELSGVGSVTKFVTDKNRLCFEREIEVAKSSNEIKKEDKITLTNTGDVPFTIENTSIVEKERDFWVKENTCRNIMPGKICQITIAFSPVGRKLRSGTYDIRDKDFVSNIGETTIHSEIQGVGKPRNPILRIFYKLRGYWIQPCK